MGKKPLEWAVLGLRVTGVAGMGRAGMRATGAGHCGEIRLQRMGPAQN